MAACILPSLGGAGGAGISAPSSQSIDASTDGYKPPLVRKEQSRPEAPPLVMHRRSFMITTVSNFEWTVLQQKQTAPVRRLEASAIASTLFTLRGLRLPWETSVGNLQQPVSMTSQTPNAYRRQSIVTPMVAANTAPASDLVPHPSKRRGSLDDRALLYSKTNSLIPRKAFVDLSENCGRYLSLIIVSRALELETYNRSGENREIQLDPVWSDFALEIVDLPSKGCHVVPAEVASWPPGNGEVQSVEFHVLNLTFKDAFFREKVMVTNATAKDLNELRWLLGDIVDVQGSSAFTRYVDHLTGGVKFRLMTENPELRPHPFKLIAPWRVAWKWLCKLGFYQEAKEAYITAVCTTWAPAPTSVEGTWIYKLELTLPKKLQDSTSESIKSPLPHGGKSSSRHRQRRRRRHAKISEGSTDISNHYAGDRDVEEDEESSSSSSAFNFSPSAANQASFTDKTKLLTTLDCSSDVACEDDNNFDLGYEQRRYGFTVFLWDVVMFWKGFFAYIENELIDWIPHNEDASFIMSSVLRHGLSGEFGIIGYVPVNHAVLNCWSAVNHHRRLKSFATSPIASLDSAVENFPRIYIPSKLRTTDYVVRNLQAHTHAANPPSQLTDAQKDRILVYGYQLFPDELKQDRFYFGISLAGGLYSSPLSITKERATALLEVEEGFVISSKFNGLLFEALAGTGVQAEYDETFSRYFGSYLNTMPDRPRCMFHRTATPKRQRVSFKMQEGCVERNQGLFEIMNDLSASGGVIMLRCTRQDIFMLPPQTPQSGQIMSANFISDTRTALTEQVRSQSDKPTDGTYGEGPKVTGLMICGASQWRCNKDFKHTKCYGRLRFPSLSCGIYRLRDLLACIDYLKTTWERQKMLFLSLFPYVDEIEVVQNEHRHEEPMPHTDIQCLQIPTGIEYQVIKLPSHT